MPQRNGIDVSNDERYIYVAAIGSQEMVPFDRRAAPIAKRTVPLPIRLNNVHWATNGKLLTAGPNHVPPAVCSGADCAMGWSVLDVGLLAARRRRSNGRDAAREFGHTSG